MVGREVWVKFFLCKWWEPIMAIMSLFERKNWDGWIQDDGIQDGRIQDGHHHQDNWKWMSLSQIELVWVRVRVEGECFWVNLREENKVSEFHYSEAESKMAEFKMAEFKMATIIKLSQNELVWARVRVKGESFWVNPREDNKVSVSKMALSESDMAEFKMADIIKFSENEWVKVFLMCKWWEPILASVNEFERKN